MKHTPAGRAFLWFGRAALSGVLSLAALTAFCFFYYNVPVHYTDPDGAADYVRQSGAFYCQATEGFSHGRTNNEGFRSPTAYSDGMDVDVLILGSSQMEAGNVLPEQSTAGVLTELLPGETVYNIGMSSHGFLTCAGNLAAAVEKYAPSRFAVMETSSVRFSARSVQMVLDGTYPEIPSRTDGLLGTLQKNQFLRLLYKQYTSLSGRQEEDADGAAALPPQDTGPLRTLLERLADETAVSGARLIIVYHPGTSLAPDGTLQMSGDEADKETFAQLCRECGILFLDMGGRFAAEYEARHVLPYGFSNTSVGSGHLNRYGHEMLARELCALMKEAAP